MSQTIHSNGDAAAALAALADRVVACEEARRGGSPIGAEAVRADLPKNLPPINEDALVAAAVTALGLPATTRVIARDTSKAWILAVLDCGPFGVVAKRETGGRAYCWAVPSATGFAASNELLAA